MLGGTDIQIYGFVAFGHHSAKHVGQLVLDGDRKVVGDTYCFLKRLPGQVLSYDAGVETIY